jgi:hypothetical protein
MSGAILDVCPLPKGIAIEEEEEEEGRIRETESITTLMKPRQKSVICAMNIFSVKKSLLSICENRTLRKRRIEKMNK